MEHVSLPQFFDDSVFFNFIRGLRRNSLMEIGIELFPLCLNRLQTKAGQRILKLLVNQLKAAPHIFAAFAF